MTDAVSNRTLYALFCLSRDTCHIDVGGLSRATGETPTRIARALVELEQAGLVDATRARLTMLGLAKAAAAGEDLGGIGLDLEAARAEPESPLPIAARSSIPPAPRREPELDIPKSRLPSFL